MNKKSIDEIKENIWNLFGIIIAITFIIWAGMICIDFLINSYVRIFKG